MLSHTYGLTPSNYGKWELSNSWSVCCNPEISSCVNYKIPSSKDQKCPVGGPSCPWLAWCLFAFTSIPEMCSWISGDDFVFGSYAGFLGWMFDLTLVVGLPKLCTLGGSLLWQLFFWVTTVLHVPLDPGIHT